MLAVARHTHNGSRRNRKKEEGEYENMERERREGGNEETVG